MKVPGSSIRRDVEDLMQALHCQDKQHIVVKTAMLLVPLQDAAIDAAVAGKSFLMAKYISSRRSL